MHGAAFSNAKGGIPFYDIDTCAVRFVRAPHLASGSPVSAFAAGRDVADF
ncbi:hypothetical protein KFU94_16470 [Chloroflexi bacterium TSY]|nr:hypothetical protein [Chloroflexi bacterium TSY]